MLQEISIFENNSLTDTLNGFQTFANEHREIDT